MIYVGVLKPESEAGIHVEFGTLPHHGSIEILRNYHLAADTLQDMVLAVYRTALAHEEGVAGGELCSLHEIIQELLHVYPQTLVLIVLVASVEHLVLRLHIGEIERLLVYGEAVQTVVRRTEMSMVES